MKFKTKIITVGGSIGNTIPVNKAKKQDFKKGDFVEVTIKKL